MMVSHPECIPILIPMFLEPTTTLTWIKCLLMLLLAKFANYYEVALNEVQQYHFRPVHFL